KLLAPLPLGLEARVANRLAPRRDDLADGGGVRRVAPVRLDRGEHVGNDAQERAERHAGLDAVLPALPRGLETALDLLEVVQEEPFRAVEKAIRLAAAERLHRGEDVAQLLRERRLRDLPVPDAEELDLAMERRRRVLGERADDVVARREGLVRIEAPAGEADQVRRV